MSYLSYIVEVESYRVSQNLFSNPSSKKEVVRYILTICLCIKTVCIYYHRHSSFPFKYKKIWFFPEICGLLEFRENCATLEKMLE